jgi:hypothetical protein
VLSVDILCLHRTQYHLFAREHGALLAPLLICLSETYKRQRNELSWAAMAAAILVIGLGFDIALMV